MGAPQVTWSRSETSISRKVDEKEFWRDNAGRHLYMYLDESGNLDFGRNGTPYFIMTCAVARRPFLACDSLRSYRYDLWEQGQDVENSTHARIRTMSGRVYTASSHHPMTSTGSTAST